MCSHGRPRDQGRTHYPRTLPLLKRLELHFFRYLPVPIQVVHNLQEHIMSNTFISCFFVVFLSASRTNKRLLILFDTRITLIVNKDFKNNTLFEQESRVTIII